jgi:ribonuclease R
MTPEDNSLPARILKHLGRKDYHPQRPRRLARVMGIEEEEYGSFRTAVKELMHAGRVVLSGGNNLMLPAAGAGAIVGNFRGHVRGFGFVVPDSPAAHGDLFIPPGATMGAITGDTVAARITRRGKGGDESRVEGEIVEIIARGQNRFVGELVREGREWMMIPDGHLLYNAVQVGDVGSSRAKAGDQVVVELSEFPAPDRPARGVIVEVLGRRGDPGIDTLSIIRQYHFRDEFPEAVLEDARRAVREHDLEEELSQREDLRNQTIVTIDPDDARDFDDAISIRRLAHGWELGVHIADVSTFVTSGGPLDAEATLRGNSVYLPGLVLPMLPGVLSNGLCSLQEAQPRLTKSAFIEYDAKGNRKATRFANTVIQSRKRLTYGQVTKILAGETAGCEGEVVELLQRMDHLARVIQKRRLAAGMIVLSLPEVELVLGDDNEAIGVAPADTSFSHTIIEMFMVEANEAVAELMAKLGVPHLRRIHPEPPPDSQRKLAQFMRVMGMPLPEKLNRRDLIRLLARVKGTPEAFSVNLAVLRSMAQAEYSPKLIGHFALASEHYSHFTSPIRRYPDLVLHRLLEVYLAGQLKSRKQRQSVPSTQTLQEISKRCGYTERRAEDAERELKQLKILRLLENRLGEEEGGTVTGVANIGVYVQLDKYLIDGLLRFSDMEDDWWEVDTRSGRAIGQRSGHRIGIGDRVRVRLASIDLAARELDLALVQAQERKVRPRREAPPPVEHAPLAKKPVDRPAGGKRPYRAGFRRSSRRSRGRGR